MLRTKRERVADVSVEYRAAMEAGAGLELVGELLLASTGSLRRLGSLAGVAVGAEYP